MIFLFIHQPCSTYVPPALEPVEVTKTMDNASHNALYRTPEEPTTVLTLECNSLKADAASHAPHAVENSVKLETLSSANANGHLRAPSVDPSVPVSAPVQNTAAPGNTWTPLTPPQSALQQ